MTDPTEPIRRERLAEINSEPGNRAALEAQYGQVWTTDELSVDFEVIGFMAPLVVVRRKADGVKGKATSNEVFRYLSPPGMRFKPISIAARPLKAQGCSSASEDR